MKIIQWLIIIVAMSGCTAAQINQALSDASDVLNNGTQLTTGEVAEGLKAALEKGISKGSDQASQEDGYFQNPQLKIPFPKDVQKVEDKLRQIGLNNQVDNFILSMNRGAEMAAREAKPIFVSAIKAMTIEDAWSILKGEKNAATNYLRKTTGDQLYDKFKPVISSSLEKVNATKYYSDIINTYNRIPLVEKVNPDLEDYTTQKAIDGLFILIAKEELKIRENPVERTTELLKKVFAQQD